MITFKELLTDMVINVISFLFNCCHAESTTSPGTPIKRLELVYCLREASHLRHSSNRHEMQKWCCTVLYVFMFTSMNIYLSSKTSPQRIILLSLCKAAEP